jgi:hypothetical protein
MGDILAAFRTSGNPAILVANGATKVFNPTIKQSVIDRAYEDDPQVAASEWGGQFRSDLESYVSPEIVDQCTARNVFERPHDKQWKYVAHADPSGGSQDSFTLAIGHVEGEAGILDLLIERRPPFSPADVVAEMAEALATYHLSEVTGDKFGAGFTVEAFAKCGINYRYADKTTSDYFGNLLPILMSRRCQLLDNKRLQAQLCSLERRASRGGKDSIGHPPLGHDDCAASVAGLMVRLVGQRDYSIKSWHPPPPGIGRNEAYAAMEESIFANAGIGLPGGGYGDCEKPGGWGEGESRTGSIGAQLGWTFTGGHRRN